jgi:hypothetical protein
MNMSTTKSYFAAALAMLLGVCACTINGNAPTGQLQTDAKEVKLGDAKSVRVEIKMGAGELKVVGGAKDLLDGQFTYNVAVWKPQVEYAVHGSEGLLTIQQPGHVGSMGNARYEWDLRLNEKVPMSMSVELGAGRAELTLGKLSLNKLDLRMGAGETIVDLTGDWKNDLAAEIRGGVGRATVRLPRDVGVRVTAAGGIGAINAHDLRKEGGAYVNDAYGKSPVTLRVDVEGGVGEINLELGEAPGVV